MIYEVKRELSVPERASLRYSDISLTEVRRAERTDHGYPRVIGGDRGDLGFRGYTVHEDRTVLDDPALLTSLEGLSEDEVGDIAEEILAESYASVGVETVEHN